METLIVRGLLMDRCRLSDSVLRPRPLTISSPNTALLLCLRSQKGHKAAVPERVANNQRIRKLPTGSES
jgi:hypothetical protein